MRRRVNPNKPSSSKAVRRLLALAVRDGINVQVLLQMLAAVNAPSTLAGLVQICRRLKSFMPRLQILASERLASALRGWPPVLNWLTDNPRRLARCIYWRLPKAAAARSAFLRNDGPNPVERSGVKRYALVRMLFDSRPDDDCASGQALLELCATAAHILIATTKLGSKNWWYGIEPEHGFFEALYRPCLMCRHFREETAWHSVASQIPAFTSLQQLRADLRQLADTRQPAIKTSATPKRTGPTASEGLKAIAWMIDWGLIPTLERVSRSRNGTLSQLEGVNDSGFDGDLDKTHPVQTPSEVSQVCDIAAIGAGESGEVQVLAPDEDDPNSGRVCVRVDWAQDELRFKQLHRIGDHPGEELATETMYLADDAYGRALSYGGNTEVANQRLPYSYQDLAVHELARFLEDIPRCLRPDEAAIVHAFVLLTLLTGASKETVCGVLLRTLPVAPRPERCAVLLVDRGSYILVHCQHVHLKPENHPPHDLARRCTETLVLTNPAHKPLIDALSALPFDTPLSKWISESSSVAKPVFSVDVEWFEQRLAIINDGQKYPRKITIDKLRRILPQVINEITAGDFVIVSDLTDAEDYLASIAHHYATLDVSYLDDVYIKAVRELSRRLARVGYALQCIDSPNTLATSEEFVGSPLCPATTAYRDAFASLRSAVGSLPLLCELTLEDFARRHNSLIAYGVLTFSLTALGRGTTLYIDPSEIDYATRLASIRDKTDFAGSKARCVLFAEPAYKQVEAIHLYLVRLADEQPLEGVIFPHPSRRVPAYFLKPDGNWYEITPSGVEDILKGVFEFGALNFGRHYVASRVRELSALSFEMTSGALGHARAGQEIYGRFSSIHPRVWRVRLERALVALFEELKFEVVNPAGWFSR